MEELLHHPIINLTLAPSFDKQQWILLTRQDPSLYQQQISTISRLLDQHMPELTIQYYKFTQNRLTLQQWYQSEAHLQHIIQPYLFSS